MNGALIFQLEKGNSQMSNQRGWYVAKRLAQHGYFIATTIYLRTYTWRSGSPHNIESTTNSWVTETDIATRFYSAEDAIAALLCNDGDCIIEYVGSNEDMVCSG
jgi:hypothetical protein